MEKILIVEDDKDIAELVCYNLQKESYSVTIADKGNQALQLCKDKSFDLIILDLMLPDLSGTEICKWLKKNSTTKDIPIMMLTAKGEEVDKVVGFELGADDYMTKPFSVRELLLRVKAILRRASGVQEADNKKLLSAGLLSINKEKFLVLLKGKEIKLTAIEFKLLAYLMERPGRVATRDQLLDQVWGYEAALTTRTVDTHVKRLRFKLGKAGDYIETIRGVGYRFTEKT